MKGVIEVERKGVNLGVLIILERSQEQLPKFLTVQTRMRCQIIILGQCFPWVELAKFYR